MCNIEIQVTEFHYRCPCKFESFGLLLKLTMCSSYIGDASAASSLSEAEVDKRVQVYADMEDPDIVVDLHELHKGKISKFDIFRNECAKNLQKEVVLAVDERRHSQVTHTACALSVRDLREQVAAKCPTDTPIPFRSWMSLQFWPKIVHAKSSVHYTVKTILLK